MAIESQQAERELKIIADSLEQGKDFVLTQAPDVVQQLIAWKRAETAICIVLGLAMIAGCVLIIRGLRRSYREAVSAGRQEDLTFMLPAVLFGACAIVLAVLGCAVIASNVAMCLQVWLAPKVFILEYLGRIAT